ncbi:MAG: ribonuclease Y [Deltaproteobacteria bacterium]|nr:ribonuclease Y [Deltaproteobacteria bacterium]
MNGNELVVIGVGCLALIVGAVVGYWLRVRVGRQQLKSADAQARLTISQAENQARQMKREAELEIKDRELKARAALEREMQEKQREQGQVEKRLVAREEGLEKRFDMLEAKEADLRRREQGLNDRRANVEGLEKKWQEQTQEVCRLLEKAAGMTVEEAKRQLIESVTEEARLEAAKLMRKIDEETRTEADQKARHVIATAIERLASDYVAERAITTVALPNDEMKGRIIGREGRNIRAFEAATGVEVVVDDTPDVVTISCFNPIRREIARRTLAQLIQDGRIHPARVEETVGKMTKEVEASIKEAGEQALMELGIHGMHAELVRLVGALKYRYSYAQNVLQHSVDVGFLCGMMAAELGLSEKKARRAGLLHDVGKAVTHEVEGSHALIGMELAKKYREDFDVCHAIGAHHEDIAQEYPLDCLVDAADALSGARPGARREVLETYMKRLEDLEKVSTSFKGVDKAFAIQAGREIRVMVNPTEVSDAQATLLSKDIARKIEHELTYPGQIRVTVIREMRAVETAK